MDECGAVSGMIGRGDGSTRRKPAPVPICPPQIARELSWTRTWAAAVGSRRLTGLTARLQTLEVPTVFIPKGYRDLLPLLQQVASVLLHNHCAPKTHVQTVLSLALGL
jgi:hypothetical protein